MSSLRSSLLALFAATVLVLGASACSGDDEKADDPGTTESKDADSDAKDEANGADDSTGDEADASEGDDGSSDAAFGVSREEIAGAIEGAMPDVDKVDVDGTTLTLNVPDGSMDDPMNASHCRIATEVVGIGDTVMLALPDGDFECGVDDQDD